MKCSKINKKWFECDETFIEAKKKYNRLLNASISPEQKMKGVSSLLNTFPLHLLKNIAVIFDGRYVNYSTSEDCFSKLFLQFKNDEDFKKYILKKLMDYHQKSVARPIVHLTKNPVSNTETHFDECPICYLRKANIQTNCKHHYCGKCLTAYYEKNKKRECPLCREKIKTLLYNDKFNNKLFKKINNKLGNFRFKYKKYSDDWNKKMPVLDENNDNDIAIDDDDDFNGEIILNETNIISSFNGLRSFMDYYILLRSNRVNSQTETKPESEKNFHQQFYELRQQGVYVRRNGFRFRRSDFIL